LRKILVIIPTFNEAENISSIVPLILNNSNGKNEYHVLVVDDNSPDGTSAIVENMMKTNDRIHLLKRMKKSGLGTAYVDGFKYSIENNYDLVFEMDADFSHDPKYLPEFTKKIDEGYDLVIGSRYCKGISVLNWPLSRLILSYTANVYTRLVTGLKIKDTTAGFMCYRVSALKEIDLDLVRSNGYSFQIEMKFKFYKKGFKLVEIPILFIDRRAGESKLSRKVVYEAYFLVWKLKLKSILGKL
jgi:dolichol-phosphate mannosyltransferase